MILSVSSFCIPFRFGLELHIVSHNQLYANFTEAVNNPQGVSVIAVLFHVTDRVNMMLRNILDSAEDVKDEPGKSNPIKRLFSPENLLPKYRSSYFRYEGSLTTPQCDEAVVWTVLESTIAFAITQIDRFKQVKGDDGSLLTHNYRQVQRLNSRPLIYVRDDLFSGTIFGAAPPSVVQLPLLTLAVAATHLYQLTSNCAIAC